MKKNKNIIIASIITILIVGGLTATYAYLSVGGKQERGNTFSSGCLNISIENESNAISLNNVYPITDVEGLANTPYTFTIKNTCSTSTNYQINLESLNQVSNTLDDDYIKVALSSDTSDNVISLLKDNPSITPSISEAYQANNLYTGTINGNTSKTYNLRIWIDYDTTVEQGSEKVYSSKINVIANPDLTVENNMEIKSNINDNTLSGAITGTVSSGKYCITDKNVCTPNINLPISNKTATLTLSENENAMVCTSLNNSSKIQCSDKYSIINYLKTAGDNGSGTSFLDSNVARSAFETVTTLDNKNIPDNVIYSWDVSAKQNGSIMAWYTDNDNDSLYELYIGQDGGVKANPNSSYLFRQLTNVSNIDLSNFDTSNVTDMESMFGGASKLTSLDLSGFDTSKVTDMSYMFSGVDSLTSLDLSSFDTSNVTDMSWMFNGASKLTSLDLSGFDTSKVTDMSVMFQSAWNLTSLDLSNFDTFNVTDMSWMFSSASNLTSLDLSSFDTSNVTNMSHMFGGTNSLISLDLSNFDTSKVTDMQSMFGYTSRLQTLKLNKASFNNVTSYDKMFDSTSVSNITVKDTAAQTFINSRLSDVSKSATVTIAS